MVCVAPPDNVTDIIDALDDAIDAVSTAGGGELILPGSPKADADQFYRISRTLVVPKKVILRGNGERITQIKAADGFTDPYLVRLGEAGGGHISSCRVERMTLHTNDIDTVIGLYSDSAQEECGPVDCTINHNYRGITLESGGSQIANNCMVRGVTVSTFTDDLSRPDLIGIDIGTAKVQSFDAVTVVIFTAGGSGVDAPVGASAIQLRNNAAGDFNNIHIEGYDAGVAIGDTLTSASNVGVHNINGPGTKASVTDLVRINTGSNGTILTNIIKRSAVNAINDTVEGNLISASIMPLYVTGTGSGSDRMIYAHTNTVRSRLPELEDFRSYGNAIFEHGAAGTAIKVGSDADADQSLRIYTSGRVEWGDGAGAWDSFIERVSASLLQLGQDDWIRVRNQGGMVFEAPGTVDWYLWNDDQGRLRVHTVKPSGSTERNTLGTLVGTQA